MEVDVRINLPKEYIAAKLPPIAFYRQCVQKAGIDSVSIAVLLIPEQRVGIVEVLPARRGPETATVHRSDSPRLTGPLFNGPGHAFTLYSVALVVD